MGGSIIDIQRDAILNALRRTTQGEWMVLVVDEESRKLMDNAVKEDDILNENVTHVEQITEKRRKNPDTDAIYLLSAEPYVVDCLISDLERRRYRRAHLIWTSDLDLALRRRIDDMQPQGRDQIATFRVLPINYFPRESHLVTFRDPWSFLMLFHRSCGNLVKTHMRDLAQKVTSLCVSLGEYPVIRFYRPQNASHEASVLCSHLARFIQDELDSYAQQHPDFSPRPNRARGAMYIVDRSIDLFTPLLHEFTYQAMAHDLLPIRDGDKIYYKTIINAGEPNEQEKEMIIGEGDKIWVENRHRHMKDTIEKLMNDFKRFMDDNHHFADSENATSLNAIKDMLAGLPQFQELKEAYSLHLNMAQDCMNIFQQRKLADLASVEQALATGLDEDQRKPKGLADQTVRLLDDDSVIPSDRMRLIMLYSLYRDGLVPADMRKLFAHAQLPDLDCQIVQNMELLGARVEKPLKDKSAPSAIFSRAPPVQTSLDEYALSRFRPALKTLLEQHINGTLDQVLFPFTKPVVDATNAPYGSNIVSQASLRSAKPTWAKTRLASGESRQRLVVVMAGGATYAEARSCYEVSQSSSHEVFLVTSHMLSPTLFLRQLGDLSMDRRRLDLPSDRPPRKAPEHLFEPEPKPQAPPPAQPNVGVPSPNIKNPGAGAPTAALGALRLNSDGGGMPMNGKPNQYPTQQPHLPKLEKAEKPDKKKKHKFFSSKK